MDKGNEDFQRILVGVDDSSDALLAFHYAITKAKEDDAQLILASVLEDEDVNVYEELSPNYVHGKREDLVKHMEKYEAEAKNAGVKHVSSVISSGNAGEAIVKDIIPHVEPDLLIIGARSKRGLARHFGSQAAYMTQYAPISVMVIR